MWGVMTFFWARTFHLNLSLKDLPPLANMISLKKSLQEVPEPCRRLPALVKLNWPLSSNILCPIWEVYEVLPLTSTSPFLPAFTLSFSSSSPGLSLIQALSWKPCSRSASSQPFPQTGMLFLGSTPMARGWVMVGIICRTGKQINCVTGNYVFIS